MNYRIISCVGIALIMFCVCPSATTKAELYEPRVDYVLEESVSAAAIADLDGDGAQDLVFSSTFFTSCIWVLLGNGDGTFQTPLETYGGPYEIVVADLNGDGIPDLVTVHPYADRIWVWLGNGDGTFQTEVRYRVGDDPEDVAVGDLDGDSFPDLVVVNNDSNNISVLQGNGDGTFQVAVNYWVMEYPSIIVMEDFDGDGHADLAVSSYLGQVRILLGNGDATFRNTANYQVEYGIYSIATDDLNGDGIPDLVTANSVNECVLVSLGNGDGTFQEPVTYEIVGYPYSVAITDHDGDSIPDLVTANKYGEDHLYGNTVSVMLGYGDGTFLPPIYHETGLRVGSATVGDLNNDGGPDLVVTNVQDANISVLINKREPGITLFITDYSCVPMHGTMPFDTRMSMTLLNRVSDQTRRVAARIHLNLANGQSIASWRAGYTNIVGGADTRWTWDQTIPALGSMIGRNRFTLVAEDVTPAPWNQPPYPASGYTDIKGCTIIAVRP